jgi:hypothetical protein
MALWPATVRSRLIAGGLLAGGLSVAALWRCSFAFCCDSVHQVPSSVLCFHLLCSPVFGHMCSLRRRVWASSATVLDSRLVGSLVAPAGDTPFQVCLLVRFGYSHFQRFCFLQQFCRDYETTFRDLPQLRLSLSDLLEKYGAPLKLTYALFPLCPC